ncbi:MAG: tetratricopeptide repeat protein [Myxococcaceae bacterium]
MRFLILLFLLGCQPKPISQPTYAQAEKLFEDQKFIDSAKMLSKLLDQDPKLPGARNLLARCFFFLGNPDRSIEELQFVLSTTSPGAEASLDALFLMGAVTLESNNLSEKNRLKGLKAWEVYLKVAPKSNLTEKVVVGLAELKALDDPQKATDLARSYIQQSKVSKALAVFERVLKKQPNYVPAWHYQGMAFIMQGEPKKAVASWKEVFKKDPIYAKKFKLDQRIAVAEKL